MENPLREFSGTIRRARIYARPLTAAELASGTRGPGDEGVRLWFDAATVEHTEQRPRARTFLAYGGDWGDNPNDGNFSADGIVTADRGHTGKAAEIKRVLQAVHAAPASGGTTLTDGALTLTNEYLFTDLREFDATWALVADGRTVRHGRLSRAQLDLAPLSKKRITVPLPLPEDPAPGTEYFLELSFTTREDTPWAEAGFEIAREQIPVDAGSPEVTPVPLESVPSLRHTENGTSVIVRGRNFSVTLDKRTGTLTSYEAGGHPLLADGPAPNFWRAPTDNDRGNGQHTRNRTWRDAGARREVTGVTVRALRDKAVEIKVTGTLPTTVKSAYTTTYTVFGNGETKVDHTLHPGASSLPYIPEVGSLLLLPGRLEHLRYYGRGPEENHWDRKDGTDVGVYSSTVSEQWTSYSRPQENGNRTDVRWAALTGRDGTGLLVTGDALLEVNASHFTPEDLSDGVRHDYQLTPARRSCCGSTTGRWASAATTAGARRPTRSTSSPPTATTPTATGCARCRTWTRPRGSRGVPRRRTSPENGPGRRLSAGGGPGPAQRAFMSDFRQPGAPPCPILEACGTRCTPTPNAAYAPSGPRTRGSTAGSSRRS